MGFAEPLSVALGGEYRKETYEIEAGDAAVPLQDRRPGLSRGFGLTDAAQHDRDNKAVYVDVATAPIAALHLDFAARYEDFSDFGNTTVGKLTARYDFSPAFALRGTVSSGFRAPTLAEEYYSATTVSPTTAGVRLPPNNAAAAPAGHQPAEARRIPRTSVSASSPIRSPG